MGSLSIWHWLVVLLLVLLIFGSKKVRGIGADLGSAVRGFRDSVRGVKEVASEARSAVGASISEPKPEQSKKEKAAV